MKKIIPIFALLVMAGCSETPDEQFVRACNEMKKLGPPIYVAEKSACRWRNYLSPEQKAKFAKVWFDLKAAMDGMGAKNLRLDENGNYVPR